MKKFILKILKTMAVLIIIVLVLMISVATYEYVKVELSASYNAETMTLNYDITGSGDKNILLIHGLAGSKNYWKRGTEHISKARKLFMVDLLGFGDSPKPQSSYSLAVQIEAIEKIILKEGINNGKTIIVGHSLGAIISLALFAKHPDWFEGVTTIGLPVITSEAQFKKQMAANSWFDKLAVSRFGKIFCMLQPLYMIKWLKPKNMTEDVFSDAKKHTWQSYYYSLNEVILKTDLDTITKNINKKGTHNVCMITGLKTPMTNVKKFAIKFPNAQLVEVKNGDHQLFLKAPDEIWEWINQFSESLESPSNKNQTELKLSF